MTDLPKWIDAHFVLAPVLVIVVMALAHLWGRRKDRKEKQKQIAGRVFKEENIEDK